MDCRFFSPPLYDLLHKEVPLYTVTVTTAATTSDSLRLALKYAPQNRPNLSVKWAAIAVFAVFVEPPRQPKNGGDGKVALQGVAHLVDGDDAVTIGIDCIKHLLPSRISLGALPASNPNRLLLRPLAHHGLPLGVLFLHALNIHLRRPLRGHRRNVRLALVPRLLDLCGLGEVSQAAAEPQLVRVDLFIGDEERLEFGVPERVN